MRCIEIGELFGQHGSLWKQSSDLGPRIATVRIRRFEPATSPRRADSQGFETWLQTGRVEGPPRSMGRGEVNFPQIQNLCNIVAWRCVSLSLSSYWKQGIPRLPWNHIGCKCRGSQSFPCSKNEGMQLGVYIGHDHTLGLNCWSGSMWLHHQENCLDCRQKRRGIHLRNGRRN